MIAIICVVEESFFEEFGNIENKNKMAEKSILLFGLMR